MNENAQPSGPAALNMVSEKIHPTLFIALGGTGMKVNIRLRRRILNAIWGGNNQVQQIADFPWCSSSTSTWMLAKSPRTASRSRPTCWPNKWPSPPKRRSSSRST
ncbi:hypothetical protein NWF32_05500 [Pseudomonas qingdaonensis]|nr:hypothetical protein [Pseudomonas qingdaonensis]